MKIKIVYPGTLNISKLKSGQYVEVCNDTDLKTLLIGYGLKEHHLKFIIPVVNGKDQDLNYILQDNDELNIYMPVGGG